MSASLDSALDPMEEIRFRKKHSAIWIEIQKETHFTFDELEQIMVIFFKIQKRDEKPAASDLISSIFIIRWVLAIIRGSLNSIYVLEASVCKPLAVTGASFIYFDWPVYEWNMLILLSALVFYSIEGVNCYLLCYMKVLVLSFDLIKCLDLLVPSVFSKWFLANIGSHFRDVLHNGLGMTDAYMMERVMVALDRGTSPHVTMSTFAKAMSLYLRGTLEERITYAFTCYDLLSEGHLRRETMYQLMKKSLAKASRDDDVEEAVKELVDIMLKRMDADLDGVINFQDFHETVTKTPSLLESLGYCLPERPAVYAFVATWCPRWDKM